MHLVLEGPHCAGCRLGAGRVAGGGLPRRFPLRGLQPLQLRVQPRHAGPLAHPRRPQCRCRFDLRVLERRRRLAPRQAKLVETARGHAALRGEGGGVLGPRIPQDLALPLQSAAGIRRSCLELLPSRLHNLLLLRLRGPSRRLILGRLRQRVPLLLQPCQCVCSCGVPLPLQPRDRLAQRARLRAVDAAALGGSALLGRQLLALRLAGEALAPRQAHARRHGAARLPQ